MDNLTPKALAAAHALASIYATQHQGHMTPTESRLSRADILDGLTIDERYAARMEARRILGDASANA